MIVVMGGIAYVTVFSNPMVDQEKTVDITSSHFGRFWPLTVDSGSLDCVGTGGSDKALLFVSGGTKYALDDAALNAGYSSIEPIRKDTDVPGMKMSIINLIDLAKKKC